MSTLRAVVPADILRKWDAIAAAQLFSEASRLAEQVERLSQDLYWAEQPIGCGACDCYVHRSDDQPIPIGLMKDGQIVRIVSAEVTP